MGAALKTVEEPLAVVAVGEEARRFRAARFFRRRPRCRRRRRRCRRRRRRRRRRRPRPSFLMFTKSFPCSIMRASAVPGQRGPALRLRLQSHEATVEVVAGRVRRRLCRHRSRCDDPKIPNALI